MFSRRRTNELSTAWVLHYVFHKVGPASTALLETSGLSDFVEAEHIATNFMNTSGYVNWPKLGL